MRFFIWLLFFNCLYALNFTPLVEIEYDKQKALLGKKLFNDTNLSPKNDISCAKCHDVNLSYSGVAKISDVGLDKNPNYNQDIYYPSVINAGYNYLFYHDASVYRIKHQVQKSFENEIEMASSREYVEKILNINNDYLKYFKLIYGKKPNYDDAIDAIVEFEKSLVSLNSKFDKYLRHEIELNENEMQGMELFQKYACNSCHSGANLGGNIVAKLGDEEGCFKPSLLGYYNVTGNEMDKNYIKVPSIRNIIDRNMHINGNDDFLDFVIHTMVFCRLGITPNEKEIEQIKAFLYTLEGEKPEILNEELK